jgi:hypothetical protein
MQFIAQSQSLINWLETKVNEEKEKLVQDTFERKILRNPKAKARFMTWKQWTTLSDSDSYSIGDLSAIIQKAYRVRYVVLQSSIAICDTPDAFCISSSRVTKFVPDCKLIDQDTKETMTTPNIIQDVQALITTIMKNRGCTWMKPHDIADYGHVENDIHTVHWPLAMFVPHSAKIVKAVVENTIGASSNHPLYETSDEEEDDGDNGRYSNDEMARKVQIFATYEQVNWALTVNYWRKLCPSRGHIYFTKFRTLFMAIQDVELVPIDINWFYLKFQSNNVIYKSELLKSDDMYISDKIESESGDFFSLSEFIESIQPKLARNRAIKRRRE